MPEKTYRDALKEGLREEMLRDDTVFLMGEDIGRNWGGAFKVTKGLAEEFGDERVRDTPISENTIAGAALGQKVAPLAGLNSELSSFGLGSIFFALAFLIIRKKDKKLERTGATIPRVARIIRGER